MVMECTAINKSLIDEAKNIDKLEDSHLSLEADH